MTAPDKNRVLSALVDHLSQLAEQAASSAKSIRDDATHAEAKPENSKDTRALEQTYLARGKAMRAEEVVEQVNALRFMPLRAFGEGDAIGSGALVRLESDEGARCVFLSPHGGGTELTVEGGKVLVVTPQSPLGALLLGRFVGDEFEQRVRGALRAYVIVSVS